MAQPMGWHAPQLSSSIVSSSIGCPCTNLSSSHFFSTSIITVPRKGLHQNNARKSATYVCTLSTFSRTDEESIVSIPPKERKNPTLRQLILKPPLSDTKLAERFLRSPQLQLRTFPLLSACLPLQPLREEDQEWMKEYLLEAKNALGYDLEFTEPQDDNPRSHLDTLLFLCFQHKFTTQGKKKWLGIGHSRLAFLGQYVIELALCELFLQIYPRDRVGPLRDRVFNLTSKKVLPYWLRQASLERLLFPTEELQMVKGADKQIACRDVFWALVAAVYVTSGMPEVYRLLFDVFGMDLDAPTCQPMERPVLPDEDFLSPDLEGPLTWKEVAAYRPREDSLFAVPLLFRACVPPGMHRFRGSAWDLTSLPVVREALGYPLIVANSPPVISQARDAELELGLQLCFLHPSKFKGDHPRFCLDRLEYLGSKIKDVVGAEQLLMKHLDYPASWLERRHKFRYMNRFAGKTLREKKLHSHIIYDDERKETFERNRRLRNFTTTSVQHAIHGLGYVVYGRSEVRRLIDKVFSVEEILPRKAK